jgi:hypothetical protein
MNTQDWVSATVLCIAVYLLIISRLAVKSVTRYETSYLWINMDGRTVSLPSRPSGQYIVIAIKNKFICNEFKSSKVINCRVTHYTSPSEFYPKQ